MNLRSAYSVDPKRSNEVTALKAEWLYLSAYWHSWHVGSLTANSGVTASRIVHFLSASLKIGKLFLLV